MGRLMVLLDVRMNENHYDRKTIYQMAREREPKISSLGQLEAHVRFLRRTGNHHLSCCRRIVIEMETEPLEYFCVV
jgi:hypothetical protein